MQELESTLQQQIAQVPHVIDLESLSIGRFTQSGLDLTVQVGVWMCIICVRVGAHTTWMYVHVWCLGGPVNQLNVEVMARSADLSVCGRHEMHSPPTFHADVGHQYSHIRC